MTKNINELNRTEGANCEFNKLPFVDTTAISKGSVYTALSFTTN